MVKVLMVCLGNICRSPLAEGILKAKLPKDHFLVDSAGTSSYHIGSPPDRRSVVVAKKYSIDISNLKGRQFEVNDFDRFDFIYVMDESNYQYVNNLARKQIDRDKVNYILNEVYPTQNYSVQDPYYGGESGFESMFKILDEACEIISQRLIQ